MSYISAFTRLILITRSIFIFFKILYLNSENEYCCWCTFVIVKNFAIHELNETNYFQIFYCEKSMLLISLHNIILYYTIRMNVSYIFIWICLDNFVTARFVESIWSLIHLKKVYFTFNTHNALIYMQWCIFSWISKPKC